MRNEESRCPKCGSRERIPGVSVLSKGAEGRGGVVVEVERYPRAIFLTGPVTSELRATVCAECGFTELYAADPGDLLSAYRTREEQGERD